MIRDTQTAQSLINQGLTSTIYLTLSSRSNIGTAPTLFEVDLAFIQRHKENE